MTTKFDLRLFTFATLILIVFAGCTNSPLRKSLNAVPQIESELIAAKGKAEFPDLAVDPVSGRFSLVYSQRAGKGYTLWVKNYDKQGQIIDEPVQVNPNTGSAFPIKSSPPQIVARNERVFVVWQSVSRNLELSKRGFRFGFSRLFIARSEDGGKTFEAPMEIAKSDISSKNFFDLAIGTDGDIYVSWLDFAPKNAEANVKMARWHPDNSRFDQPIIVADRACPCCRTALSVGDQGNVFLAWRGVDRPPGASDSRQDKRDIVFTQLSDDGTEITPLTQVPVNGWQIGGCTHSGPSLAVDSDGQLHIAYYTGKEEYQGTYYALFDPVNRTFLKSVPLTQADFVPPSKVAISVDSDNNAWVIWEDRSDQRQLDLKDHEVRDANHALIRIAYIKGEQSVLISNPSNLSGIGPTTATAPEPVFAWSDGGQIWLSR